jgi:hypothetical protein
MDDSWLVTKEEMLNDEKVRGSGVVRDPASPDMSPWTIEELRAHLRDIRDDVEYAWEDADSKRISLEPFPEPTPLFQKSYAREQEIICEVTTQTGLTAEEWGLLKKYGEEKQSWNLLTRAAARRAEDALLILQENRRNDAVREALQRFRQDELPQMREQHEEEEQFYERYATRSYDLEATINASRRVLKQELPQCVQLLLIIERAGIKEVGGIDEEASLSGVREALERCTDRIPEMTREAIEQELLREHKELERSMTSVLIEM